MKNTVFVLGDLFNILPDAVVVVDAAGHIVFANAAVSGLLEYEPAELVGRALDCLIPERYREAHEAHLTNFRESGEPTTMSARPLLQAIGKSGLESPISISIANLDLNGERYSIAVMRDGGAVHTQITEAKVQAETDTLTGVGNRLRLSRQLQAALADSQPFGLLFLDLEKFKPFNDEHGHEIGDEVLRIVAKRLQAQVRSADLAVRLGGDEFVVVLDGLKDIDLLEQRAAAIAQSVARRFRIGELSGAVGVNIGGVMFPRDGATEDKLLKAADRYMYRAKLAGIPYCVGE